MTPQETPHTSGKAGQHNKAQKQKHKGKENAGGEPSKRAHALRADKDREQQFEIDIAEGQDKKKGNIGPSGQGSHRGRERNNKQTNASGRPDVSSNAH